MNSNYNEFQLNMLSSTNSWKNIMCRAKIDNLFSLFFYNITMDFHFMSTTFSQYKTSSIRTLMG